VMINGVEDNRARNAEEEHRIANYCKIKRKKFVSRITEKVTDIFA